MVRPYRRASGGPRQEPEAKTLAGTEGHGWHWTEVHRSCLPRCRPVALNEAGRGFASASRRVGARPVIRARRSPVPVAPGVHGRDHLVARPAAGDRSRMAVLAVFVGVALPVARLGWRAALPARAAIPGLGRLGLFPRRVVEVALDRRRRAAEPARDLRVGEPLALAQVPCQRDGATAFFGALGKGRHDRSRYPAGTTLSKCWTDASGHAARTMRRPRRRPLQSTPSRVASVIDPLPSCRRVPRRPRYRACWTAGRPKSGAACARQKLGLSPSRTGPQRATSSSVGVADRSERCCISSGRFRSVCRQARAVCCSRSASESASSSRTNACSSSAAGALRTVTPAPALRRKRAWRPAFRAEQVAERRPRDTRHRRNAGPR